MSIATEEERTLYFDFLPLSLGTVKGLRTRFHLYTVPGQSFYNASRKLVLQGVDGLVFVADSQVSRLDENVDSYLNLWDNLRSQNEDLSSLGMVLQMNKRDLRQHLQCGRPHRATESHRFPGARGLRAYGCGCVRDTEDRLQASHREEFEVVKPRGA